ncbi:hypothetical protein F2Q68_00017470 [Brassica cretica]|uniref:Uncharacterized protein n=1 Tax=Brassica cretica TaxID=69181 RepID=A0A8S9HT81_BRACR|nr:hypothetical protein F2Q68_00017470 [Brassica cretica]
MKPYLLTLNGMGRITQNRIELGQSLNRDHIWILNLQLDHLFNQQLVLVGLDILINDLLDSFKETESYGLGSTPVFCILKNIEKEEAYFLAARASRTENQNAIDASMVGILSDPKESRDGYIITHCMLKCRMEATAGQDCAFLEEVCVWISAKAIVPGRDIILAGGSNHAVSMFTGADQSSKEKEVQLDTLKEIGMANAEVYEWVRATVINLGTSSTDKLGTAN